MWSYFISVTHFVLPETPEVRYRTSCSIKQVLKKKHLMAMM